ncbi:hypothetical protein PAHAL_4G033800 [Panicum hallii]|uniref:Uncharacterized protein n=1 Tax=Panicum hallii TaxID=206008 RepID=A0A2T8JBL0_9POAL|nr:hypothetical protein PAHAL_4G033800 [Panicum hallii]
MDAATKFSKVFFFFLNERRSASLTAVLNDCKAQCFLFCENGTNRVFWVRKSAI